VHWHGIELESYYDGVAGWSGGGRRVAPSIAPGDTFVARLTPPRAGTFMYHVHSERGEELASGLYAPLLVVERGATFDPRTDRVLMIATAGPGADAQPPFVNGSASPDTLVFEAGTTYRLRLIDIASNDAHTLALRGPDGALATWRLLARDGRDVSDDESTPRPARENVAAGTTRDFAFTPATPGLYEFSALRILSGVPPGRPTIVPIRVK
jgi:FtsP/CotA-like multicopper oxidase with cupredoxin domain